MLFRLGHVFARRLRCIMKRWPKLGPGLRTSEVLWDAFLRSLGTSMISAWMKDLEDWQPVSCQRARLCKTCSGSLRGHGARAAYQCHLYFRFWCRSPSTSSDASCKRSVLGFLGFFGFAQAMPVELILEDGRAGKFAHTPCSVLLLCCRFVVAVDAETGKPFRPTSLRSSCRGQATKATQVS